MMQSFYDAIGTNRGIENIPQDSQTVPDMSLSVKDILTRFRRGTVDLASLVRNSDFANDDIDDDTLDGVADLVDVQQVQRQIYGKVSQSLWDHTHSSRGDSSESKDPQAGDTSGE